MNRAHQATRDPRPVWPRLVRLWVRTGPIVVALCVLLSTFDPDRALRWLALAVFLAGHTGGLGPPPILNGGNPLTRRQPSNSSEGDK